MNLLDQKLGFVDYMLSMTDEVGILQNSVYSIPDPRKGYTTDDNSRALILAVMLHESTKDRLFLKLASKYISFLLNAQNEDGTFKNIMNYNREFSEARGSEDCFGRCIWALGRAMSSTSIPENMKKTCQFLLNKSLGNWPELKSQRAKAYSIIGLSYLRKTSEHFSRMEALAMELVVQYEQCKERELFRFENSSVSGNAILPWALFRAYKSIRKDILLQTARESMDFLSEITFKNGFFKPVRCIGWPMKDRTSETDEEHPAEAFESMQAYLSYFKVAKDKKYLDFAIKCFFWYTGQNSKGKPLIDSDNGSCYDGLTENGMNYNQGAESLISYGISLMEIGRQIRTDEQYASQR